ncbi:MAG: hypothetical protein WD875_13570 [Pirellulales bacterium]
MSLINEYSTARSGLLALAAAISIAVFTPHTAAADDKPPQLPLKKVVMFSSGVGYFERRGDVSDDAKVELQFNVRDVNDLLKSMVLQDLGGGQISTVTYGSKDPITKTLKSFAIDLTTNPTLAELLVQVRGEVIEIDAPDAITGTIVGVEKRQVPGGKDNQTIEVEFLNLLTDKGLRSVSLANVGRIKLVNAELDAEFRQALAVLATGHSTDKKSVTLEFLGKGQRAVRVGYIHESPIWKTSYRLVLDDKKPPMLQGWAIVENTTDSDWENVDLTLISGRPISFVMDLYQPLYLPRPVVEPELFASLRPQTYEQDLERAEADFRNAAKSRAGSIAAGGAPAPAAPAFAGEDKAADRAPAARRGRLLAEGRADGDGGIDVGASVQSAAQASDLGEMFQYAIANPVTLGRQRSAMLPIVNESVQGERVSIYNQSVHAKHPLAGLKLKNSTPLHLMQGPITVFDSGAYAGDAKIQDLQPGSERLISYAMDLGTEVAPTTKSKPQALMSVRIAKGVLYRTFKYVRGVEYTVKNSGERAKTVLIEYAHDPNWTLVAPKEAAEKTRDMYRFSVAAEPGKPVELAVSEERTVTEQVGLTNLDDNSIRFYVASDVVGDDVKKAMQEVVRRKQEIAAVVAERQESERRANVIRQEQERIRENLKVLPKDSELARTYIKKFADQEQQVDGLQRDIDTSVAKENKLRRELDEYLVNLNLP